MVRIVYSSHSSENECSCNASYELLADFFRILRKDAYHAMTRFVAPGNGNAYWS